MLAKFHSLTLTGFTDIAKKRTYFSKWLLINVHDDVTIFSFERWAGNSKTQISQVPNKNFEFCKISLIIQINVTYSNISFYSEGYL